MTSPSYEDGICAMFDSFYKKSSHNFIRNLNQGETNRDKHYIGETVEYIKAIRDFYGWERLYQRTEL